MAFEKIKRWFTGLRQTGTGGEMMESKRVKQLWGRQFSVVKEGLAEDQVVAYVNELMSKYKEVEAQLVHVLSLEKVLQRAAVEADKVAAGIKVQAEEEAEAARIITEAKERAQELITEAKRRAEALTDEEVRNILLAANRRAEIAETEAKQRAQLYLLKSREIIESELKEEVKVVYHRLLSALQSLLGEGETIGIEWKGKTAELWKSKAFELAAHEVMPLLVPTSEEAGFPSEVRASAEGPEEVDITKEGAVEQPVQLEEEAAVEGEAMEQPVQLEEEAVAPSPETAATAVEEPLAQQVAEEKKVEEQAELQPEPVGPNLYAGEVELALSPPVDLVMMSQLSRQLQAIPEVKILRTVGSWEQGTTITVALDKPLPLIDILCETCAVEASPESPNRGNFLHRVLGRGRGKEVKRVRIVSRGQLK